MTIDEFMQVFIPQLEKKNLVVLTGAGISTPSGIKDFRGENGIYQENQDGMNILTSDYMYDNPEAFYDFYRHYLLINESVRPNLAHEVLSDLEQDGYIKAIITQNIDGLHQEAGSKNVIEIHGGPGFYCTHCLKKYSASQVLNLDNVPLCTKCGSLIRPDIVLYGEGYDQFNIMSANDAVEHATTLLVIGTGIEIKYVYDLVHKFVVNTRFDKNKKLFIINKGQTTCDGFAKGSKYDGDVMDFARSLKQYRNK